MKTNPLPETTISETAARSSDVAATTVIPAAPAVHTASPDPAGFRSKISSGAYDAREIKIAHGLEVLSSPQIAIPIILAVGIMLFVVNLGAAPLYTKGEPREAVTVFDIVHGGGVILPMRAGVEVPSKPLLMHWLAALVSLAAGGVSGWTVRLPSAAFAIAGMLVTYLYVRKLFEARGALFSAIMLGTAFQYLQAGTGSRVDMTLTFFMTVAFFEFITIAENLSGRTTLLYLAIAVAVLTKGPIGAALPALVALVWMTLTWRWNVVRRLRLARGALIVGVIGGGWYLAAIVSGGMAFIYKQILGENFYRLVGHTGFNHGHAHPFYYEELALLAGFLPWTPIALIAGLQALRNRRRLDARLGYLLLWFLTVLVFYNLPQSKRGVYLLALYPALATMVALFLSDAISHREAVVRPLRWLAWGSGGFFVIAGVGAFAALALLYTAPSALAWMLAQCGITLEQLPGALRTSTHERGLLSIVLPLAVATVGIYLLRARPRIESIFFASAAGFVAIVLAVNLVVEPAVANTLTLRGFAREVMKIAGPLPVGYWGSLDYDFAFYSGRNIQFVAKPTDQFDLVVSSESDYRLMWPAMRARYETILRSGPTDFDGTGQMLLLRRIGSSPSIQSPPAVPAKLPKVAA
ncbi:MAG TPA: glycosyltransferase family 39 protein [Candidatus Binataceae bacterium]|nr:glycosyltransferase family 39 protein [Candidatus Binataceae bacterium]